MELVRLPMNLALDAYFLPLHILVFRNLLRIKDFRLELDSVVVNAFLQKQGQRGKIGGSAAVTHSAANKNTRKELQAS